MNRLREVWDGLVTWAVLLSPLALAIVLWWMLTHPVVKP